MEEGTSEKRLLTRGVGRKARRRAAWAECGAPDEPWRAAQGVFYHHKAEVTSQHKLRGG